MKALVSQIEDSAIKVAKFVFPASIGAVIAFAILRPYQTAHSYSGDLEPMQYTVSSAKQGLNNNGGEVCIVTAESSYSIVTARGFLPCIVDVGEDVVKYPGSDMIYKKSDTHGNHPLFVTEQHKK